MLCADRQDAQHDAGFKARSIPSSSHVLDVKKKNVKKTTLAQTEHTLTDLGQLRSVAADNR